MRTAQANKLRGGAGKFLVAAELCRRCLLATPFAGNVPHFDIIACGSRGFVAVQVKAIDQSRSKWWQFDIRRYLDVHMAPDGKHQQVGKRLPEPVPHLLCVLVELVGTGQDRFFILEWRELRDRLAKHYRENLDAHKGIRQKNPESFHATLEKSVVQEFENAWDKILRRVS